MKKCIRCGKEIDVISQDPDKVFYCKSCSLKLMNLSEKDLEFENDENNQETPNFFKIALNIFSTIFPGVNKLLKGEIIKGFNYLISGIFIPLIWIVLFVYINIFEIKEEIKLIYISFGFIILFNTLLIYIENFLEIWIRKEESN
ncbi:hypothetical protein EV215_1507 [Hypnocyclicus thermotrophus]|uniref:Uncharacterized protein n=1 Tax=Hypnocyclicus thermotrophus TaxID=1627895 RepID=A0AA46I5P6_9FUSO|nr:hypothetical protein [Hypnocyclicus thermotrophus]TDT69165.1 hypothetical protein EV215_1507 [Hypnocyclicus thermotrophus]